MNVLSVVGSVLGSVLGINDQSQENNIDELQTQVASLSKSLGTYKTLTYVFGLGFVVCLIVIFRKK
ncbi:MULTISPECIES: hypothetical protein [unclassified Arcicella]|uniref:hypothetical protein n=1 Tax=unclassified Arcicella TaxID=2644986 RepID=UPI00286197C3|nr:MULTISPECIES: hypothetical protein [unclassified Arcicella]MDR6564969.1 pheromone shutdown protein TraB [Arcicella sp. BE51]MDR6814759.1 pheromone shutdown protein TraB [Arcicella sp. BE140]MDR6826205.1 pheromone shutdown protein TraB [Arcicella sp. BE139]